MLAFHSSPTVSPAVALWVVRLWLVSGGLRSYSVQLGRQAYDNCRPQIALRFLTSRCVSVPVGSSSVLYKGERAAKKMRKYNFPPSLMHFFFFFFFCIGRPQAVPYRQGRYELEQIMNDSIELHYEVRVMNIFSWEKHGPVIPTSTHPLSVL